MDTVIDPLPWFALRVKPRHEKVIATLLQNKGYTAFLPVYIGQHRSGGRTRSVELPLFPGYLFCRFDPLKRLPIVTIPGVFSIIGVSRRIVPVDEAEIAALQLVIINGLSPQRCPFVQAGDVVRIISGPLRGLQGILQKSQGEDRLVLSVTLLQRSVSVVIDRACVSPVVSLN